MSLAKKKNTTSLNHKKVETCSFIGPKVSVSKCDLKYLETYNSEQPGWLLLV